jgi:hypothetical protein
MKPVMICVYTRGGTRFPNPRFSFDVFTSINALYSAYERFNTEETLSKEELEKWVNEAHAGKTFALEKDWGFDEDTNTQRWGQACLLVLNERS